ncbi:MAG: hypothetical protein AB1650_06330 [Candidatus Omnitrophota bacterium]
MIQEITWRKEGQVVRRKIFYKNGRLQRDTIYYLGKPVVRRVYYENGRLESVWSEKSREMKIYREDGSYIKTISTAPNYAIPDNLPRSLFF